MQAIVKTKLKAEKLTTLPPGVDIWWLKPLQDLFEEGINKNLISDFIVHGSFGDFTFNNFSDLELTIFWERATDEIKATDSKKFVCYCRKLSRFLVRVDPLQHHNFFHLYNDKLKSYPISEMPLAAYENSWSFRGVNLEANIDWSNEDFCSLGASRLQTTAGALKNPSATFLRWGSNLYSQKRLLSNIFMLPVYYYNSKGYYCSKRAALNDIQKILPSSMLQGLERASEIREQWPLTKNWWRGSRRLFVKDSIPGGRSDLLASNVFRNKKISQQVDQFLHSKAFRDLLSSV